MYSNVQSADCGPSAPNRLSIGPDASPPAPATIRRRRTSGRGAFSLVEIMIVIVIIGLLAGVVTVNVRNYLTRAKQNVARQEIANMMQALQSFWATNSRYPTTEEGLAVLTKPTDKNPEPLLAGKAGQVPVDPWGNPYVYIVTGPTCEVLSYGADGKEGGTGADTDISSENLKQ